MSIFDKGSFSQQDRLEMRKANKYWRDGYREGHSDGYKDAVDRYIPVDKD